jgi:hypothetical protein
MLDRIWLQRNIQVDVPGYFSASAPRQTCHARNPVILWLGQYRPEHWFQKHKNYEVRTIKYRLFDFYIFGPEGFQIPFYTHFNLFSSHANSSPVFKLEAALSKISIFR